MKVSLKNVLALSGGLLLCAHSAMGAEVNVSGTACWTGSVDALATSAKDMGWTTQVTGTYIDDKDKAENSYFRCIGIGGLIGGKPQAGSFWCFIQYEDGSKVLSLSESKEDGSTVDKYISGTGRHEGVSGGWTGGPPMQIGKAPQGKAAGCRKLTGKKILK